MVAAAAESIFNMLTISHSPSPFCAGRLLVSINHRRDAGQDDEIENELEKSAIEDY